MTINPISSGNTAVSATADGEVWVLSAGKTLTNSTTDGTFNASTFSDVTLHVGGTLIGQSNRDAIADDNGGPGSGFTVFVEATGTVKTTGTAGDAMEIDGTGFTLINYGLVLAKDKDAGVDLNSGASGATIFNYGMIKSGGFEAAQMQDGSALFNSGTIAGQTIGLVFYGTGAVATNTGMIRGDIAVRFSSGSNTLLNEGVVKTTGTVAVQASSNDATIINRGEIIGDISLGTANDFLDSGDGSIDGAISMGAGSDVARTGSGRQVIDLGTGNDRANAGGGNDRIIAGDGNDIANGAGGNDVVLGGNGDDILRGSSGKDTLRGGTGEDILGGGSSADDLFGGTDADVFRFGLAAGKDKIHDYEDGLDKIDLSAFGVVSFASLSISSKKGNAIIDLDAIGGSGAVVVLNAAGDLNAGDFIL